MHLSSEAFTTKQAEEVFSELRQIVGRGDILLFLSKVVRIALWRWDAGKEKPTRDICAKLDVPVRRAPAQAPPRKKPRAATSHPLAECLSRFPTLAHLRTSLQGAVAEPPELRDQQGVKWVEPAGKEVRKLIQKSQKGPRRLPGLAKEALESFLGQEPNGAAGYCSRRAGEARERLL